MNFHDLSAQHIFFEINDTQFMNAEQNKNIFPVARHKIKAQVYVHVFTSISMLQNSLSNTTSLTALEILQLLLQLLFNSSHFCAFLQKNSRTSSSFSLTFHAWKMVFHDFPGTVPYCTSSKHMGKCKMQRCENTKATINSPTAILI